MYANGLELLRVKVCPLGDIASILRISSFTSDASNMSRKSFDTIPLSFNVTFLFFSMSNTFSPSSLLARWHPATPAPTIMTSYIGLSKTLKFIMSIRAAKQEQNLVKVYKCFMKNLRNTGRYGSGYQSYFSSCQSALLQTASPQRAPS